MFDPQSDYALNKANATAIICKSVTGVHTRLTQEDFSSEAEFHRWKTWSDEDYHSIEKTGRSDDACFPLDQGRDTAGVSPEDELVAALDRAIADGQQRKAVQDKIAAVRMALTETQYRRMWMYYVDGLSITEIARREKVSLPCISNCLAEVRRRIVNKL